MIGRFIKHDGDGLAHPSSEPKREVLLTSSCSLWRMMHTLHVIVELRLVFI